MLNPTSTRLIMWTLIFVISMECMSLRRRRSSWENVLSGEERRETAVFAGQFVSLSRLPVCISAYLCLWLGPRINTVSQEPEPFDSQVFSASFLSVEHKVDFNTLKKKHLMEEGGKMSARLAKP